MKKWLADMAERVFWTYVQAFIGLLLVSGRIDIDTAQAAAVAAIPAGLAVVKAAIASRFGDKGTAALLPGGSE